MKKVNNFAGLNNFVWWVGEIINRVDPLGLGRCQVRVFGWYGDSIEDADLPWAVPMYPINNSNSFTAPALKSWVVGFFLDSEAGQFPVMMGVLPGVSQVDTGVGPNTTAVDPNGAGY